MLKLRSICTLLPAVVVFVAPLGISCRAIVGSYEVGPTASDAGADTFGIDAPPGDTPIVDTGGPPKDAPPSLFTSCKKLLDATPGATDGVYSLALKEGPTQTSCDMARGGYTLVAIRSTRTASDVWKTGAVTKTRALTDPRADTDLVLDVDWTQLGFTEVIYEIGPTRISFPTLTAGEINNARTALSTFAVRPGDEHPDCFISGVRHMACSAAPKPPGDPPQSIGWAYDPTTTTPDSPVGTPPCWWGYSTELGAHDCQSGAISPGHVWVR